MGSLRRVMDTNTNRPGRRRVSGSSAALGRLRLLHQRRRLDRGAPADGRHLVDPQVADHAPAGMLEHRIELLSQSVVTLARGAERYPDRMRNAPVVHIGYHKTATTWLQRQCLPRLGDRVALFGLDRLWAELIAPSPLEFDPGRCGRYITDLLAAHPGSVCVFSAERLCGNPHSGGYDAAEMANRIRASFDEAKILIVVREQVAMLVSNYKQYVRMGGICGFEEYLSPPRDGRMPLYPARQLPLPLFPVSDTTAGAVAGGAAVRPHRRTGRHAHRPAPFRAVPRAGRAGCRGPLRVEDPTVTDRM